MSDKARWLSIYLLLCFVPLFFYFRPSLSREIVSDRIVTDFLIFAPYVGLTLVAVLGWQINQTRIFWSALILLCLYLYLLHPEIKASDNGRLLTLQMVSVSYPLTLSIIYLLKESRLWSDQSLTRLILAALPFLLFYFLYSWAPDSYQKLFFWGPPNKAQTQAIPLLAWVSIALFLLVIFYLPELRIKTFLAALATTFIPLFYCLQAGLVQGLSGDPKILLIHKILVIVSFTVITLILLHCLLHMYWQKVYLDPLTGIPNRQALDERLHTLNGNFALAMVDIDHFKKFNDTYGHAEGDNVLRMVAQHLQGHLGDRVYRYGGEEFSVIFDDKGYENAVESMDKARHSMEKRKFILRGKRNPGYSGLKLPFQKHEHRGKKVNITISVGVAFAGKEHKSSEEVIKKADHWLYEAKSKGRNRVESEK